MHRLATFRRISETVQHSTTFVADHLQEVAYALSISIEISDFGLQSITLYTWFRSQPWKFQWRQTPHWTPQLDWCSQHGGPSTTLRATVPRWDTLEECWRRSWSASPVCCKSTLIVPSTCRSTLSSSVIILTACYSAVTVFSVKCPARFLISPPS